jgi:hypothetical protein
MDPGASAYGRVPPPNRHHRRGGGVLIPLVLILVGVVLLLQNLGLVSPEIWPSLVRLWPLLLILVGLEVLLSRRLGGSARLAVMLVALIGAGAWATANASRSGPATTTRTLDQTLQGITQADVTVNFGAGQLDLGALPAANTTSLGSLTFEGPAGVQPTASYQLNNGVGQLQYAVSGRPAVFLPLLALVSGRDTDSAHTGVALSPSIPLSVSVRTGAADAQLDFSQLRVTNLDLAIGASSARVTLPAAAGTTSAQIKGGLTALTIVVPPGVAAQLHYRGGLTTLDLDRTRFPSVGNGVYRSPDYDTAANRVDLYLDSGLSRVTVD